MPIFTIRFYDDFVNKYVMTKSAITFDKYWNIFIYQNEELNLIFQLNVLCKY